MKTIMLIMLMLIFASQPVRAQGYGGLDFGKIANPSAASKNSTVDSAPSNPETSFVDSIVVTYSGFDLSKSLTGKVSCGVTFAVENNTSYRLVQFITDLDWSGIHTKLDFQGIEPKATDYVRYRLLGEGCYTMVEKPDISVLRCRLTPVMEELKDMSFDDEDQSDETKIKKSSAKQKIASIPQEECKSLVKWRPPKQ